MRGGAPYWLAGLITAVVAGCLGSIGRPSAVANATPRPNVVLLVTDDMRRSDLQFMPQVRSLLAGQGVSFDAYFDSVSLCCPARVSILRGQYSHNTGVLTNEAGNGGFETAHASGLESATIATVMQAAGYTTGLFGKYLNNYPATAEIDYVPPGWDAWSSSTKGDAYGQYDYTLNQNGAQVDYGHDADDYGTDVYLHHATAFIDRAAADAKPFFAFVSVYAPHEPATPAPSDVDKFAGLRVPRNPAYDEADVSDKPKFIRDLPRLSAKQKRLVDELNRKRAQSLQAVDRGVANLIATLRANRQLDNTYVIFTSDNGFHLGEHRMPAGKRTAYDTDVHLPLLIRGPGVQVGAHRASIAGVTDLAPTIADLGGAVLSESPDGRSLAPMLSGPLPKGAAWRQTFLLEYWRPPATTTARTGTAQLEPADLDDAPQGPTATAAGPGAGDIKKTLPEFHGLRTARYSYVEYATGEKELYDVVKDPQQLTNLASSARPSLLTAMHQRLVELSECAGEVCRSRETAAAPV